MRDDDDDEIFDDKHWSWWGLSRAMAFAPLEGLPFVRDLVSGFEDAGPLSNAKRAALAIKSVSQAMIDDEKDLGKEPIEKVERMIVTTANAAALFSERMVPVAVAANFFDQLFDAADNIFNDQEEADRKERAKIRRESKEAREAAKKQSTNN